MKRHPGLRDLSSDHHQGLVHARHLVKAATEAGGETANETSETQVTPAEVARHFLVFWGEHTNRHFREEEEVLLPLFARYGDPREPDIVQMLVEHVQIRRLVGDLARQMELGKPSMETMRLLGDLLRNHIRHEEDVLFPLIERALPEEALAELPAQFASFEG